MGLLAGRAGACRAASAAALVAVLFVAEARAAPGGPAMQAPAPAAEPRPVSPPAAAPGGEDAALPGSPRAVVGEWMQACRAGRFDEAARFLELTDEQADRGPELARRLRAVLDRYAWVDLEKLSGQPTGARDDGLPSHVEEIARIPGPSGAVQSVKLVRDASGKSARWRFSAETVAQVDAWYSTLRNRWLLDVLPAPLLRMGPWSILYWQWVALLGLLAGAWAAGLLLARVTQAAMARLARRTVLPWDDRMVANIFGPLALLWTVGLVRLFLPLVGLFAPARAASGHLLRIGLIVGFVWALLRAADVLAEVVNDSGWAKASPASRALVPVGVRFAKIVLASLGALAVFSELGYSVTSLVAGLGIGGLALAFGAQKTVENLFGAFSIGVDQPFRLGDYVRFEDTQGTVEVIGFRSTRVRTLDRTLITIPNGKLAEMKIESMGARDRFRVSATLNLTYGTSARQLASLVESLRQMLAGEPDVWKERIHVAFVGFGASSLDVELMFWMHGSDVWDFALRRQAILFKVMELVEREGSAFAFPTRTVQLVGPLPSK